MHKYHCTRMTHWPNWNLRKALPRPLYDHSFSSRPRNWRLHICCSMGTTPAQTNYPLSCKWTKAVLWGSPYMDFWGRYTPMEISSSLQIIAAVTYFGASPLPIGFWVSFGSSAAQGHKRAARSTMRSPITLAFAHFWFLCVFDLLSSGVLLSSSFLHRYWDTWWFITWIPTPTWEFFLSKPTSNPA